MSVWDGSALTAHVMKPLPSPQALHHPVRAFSPLYPLFIVTADNSKRVKLSSYFCRKFFSVKWNERNLTLCFPIVGNPRSPVAQFTHFLASRGSSAGHQSQKRAGIDPRTKLPNTDYAVRFVFHRAGDVTPNIVERGYNTGPYTSAY
jgi:hypothetical protein